MTLNDVEKGLLKDLLHLMVDIELAKVISALEAKLPAGYQAVIDGLKPEILPVILKALDAKIDSI